MRALTIQMRWIMPAVADQTDVVTAACPAARNSFRISKSRSTEAGKSNLIPSLSVEALVA